MGSISIDLADAAEEAVMGKCDHFTIRGFVAETLRKDPGKCWPFSEESLRLLEKQGFTLPPLSAPKSKWWSCTSCVRDIDADEPKGTRSPKKIAVRSESEVTPSQSNMYTLAVVAGNAVEENENVNRERSQKDDHTTVEENANVNREKPQKDDHTTVVEENAKVNREKPEKDDHTASTSLRRARPPSMDAANTVRNKSRKLEIRKPAGNKRSKEKVNKTSTDISRRKGKQAMDEAVSSEIAGVVEDTPPKATKNRKGDNVSSESINPDMSVSTQPRKPRKSRPMSDFFDKTKTLGGRNKTRKEAPSPKQELVRAGRKRKMLPQASRKLSTAGATSENASKSCGGSDQGDHSESTDSEFERDPIKGKQRNRRFQVVDEDVVPRETSQKGTRDNDADPGESPLSVPCPPSKPRTKRKLSLAKRKRNKPVVKSIGTDEGSLVKPRTGPSTNAISQPTQDLLNEVDDNRLASDGYVRKCNPQVNDKLAISLPLPDNDHGSSSKSNNGEGWLRTGLDLVDLNSNNNPEVADRSCVLQKDDASVADRKGKAIMVQEHDEAPISQIQDTDESTLEEQEIAEIMSNKFGVCLPDKEEVVINKQSSQETTTPKSKNPLLIDLNETYEHEASLEEDNNNDNITSSPPKPVDSNAGKEEEHIQIENIPRSVDFFAFPQHHAPSPFGNFPPPPTQDNRASSSYGPILFTDHNCQWLGNVQPMANHQSPYPSSFQAFRGFNPCQSAPHQYREAAAPLLVWQSSMIPPHDHHHSHRPLSFNMDQAANLGMFSQASSMSQNPWNINSVASNGMPKCGSYHPEFSFGCNHGAAGIHGGRSMDAFNQNSMTTLPLFSRMDPRLGFDIPADRHGSPSFSKRHFPPVNQPQQRMDFQRGDSTKKPYLGNRLETSRPVFQPSSSLSFQAKRNDTTPPAVFPTIKQDGRFQPLRRESNSMRLPLKTQVGEKEKKLKGKAKDLSDVDAAMRNSSGDIVCTVNKNPADFTVVEPGNVYMLTGEDMLPGEELLVPRRATYKRRRASLCKQSKKPAGPGTHNAA